MANCIADLAVRMAELRTVILALQRVWLNYVKFINTEMCMA